MLVPMVEVMVGVEMVGVVAAGAGILHISGISPTFHHLRTVSFWDSEDLRTHMDPRLAQGCVSHPLRGAAVGSRDARKLSCDGAIYTRRQPPRHASRQLSATHGLIGSHDISRSKATSDPTRRPGVELEERRTGHPPLHM